jgi:DNA-binding transcriptional ArsR family regulator
MEYDRKDRLSERARVFKALGHPVRLQIIEALVHDGEACVCHLEHRLGLRQAYLSQHLAKLRSAGLVTDRRIGSNVFYGLGAEWVPSLLTMVRATGTPSPGQRPLSGRRRGRREPCPCPRCEESEAAGTPARVRRGAPA